MTPSWTWVKRGLQKELVGLEGQTLLWMGKFRQQWVPLGIHAKTSLTKHLQKIWGGSRSSTASQVMKRKANRDELETGFKLTVNIGGEKGSRPIEANAFGEKE